VTCGGLGGVGVVASHEILRAGCVVQNVSSVLDQRRENLSGHMSEKRRGRVGPLYLLGEQVLQLRVGHAFVNNNL